MLIISVILINVVYVLVDAQAWELADADGSAATEADEPSVRHFVAFEIFSALFFTVRAPPPMPTPPTERAERQLRTAWLCVQTEYGLRLWSCSIDTRFRGCRGLLRWGSQPMQLIDLVCVVAFYIDIFNLLSVAVRIPPAP